MTSTVAGIHGGLDIHANRPAGNAVPDGSLYSCSTHGLIYKSNLAGNSWATYATLGGSPGLVLLEQHAAAASAQLDFTTFISATYDEYLFEFVNIVPATDGAALRMRAGTGGGPTYDTGNNYSWGAWRYLNSGEGHDGSNGVAFIQVVNGIDTNANWSCNGSLRLFNPGGALIKQVKGSFTMYDDAAANLLGTEMVGAYLSTTALTAVRFYLSAGNITSGSIRVYGVAKS